MSYGNWGANITAHADLALEQSGNSVSAGNLVWGGATNKWAALYTAAMSAFTPMNDALLAKVISPFGFRSISWSVATEGIENSNFFVLSQDAHGTPRELVLTVFEHFGDRAIPWFIELLDRLGALGLPVPRPLRAGGRALFEVAGKPAVLVPRLVGGHPDCPSRSQCKVIGAALNRVHQCQIAPPTEHPAPAAQLQALLPFVDRLPEEEQRDALEILERWSCREGESVLCHGDLFRDNALFCGGTLTGLLDFYNAGHELAVWDLGVVVNDWCVDAEGRPDAVREFAVLEGYEQKRLLSEPERALLPLAATVAALRFWLSRLRPQPVGAEGLGSKDPEVFARIYRHRRRRLSLTGAS